MGKRSKEEKTSVLTLAAWLLIALLAIYPVSIGPAQMVASSMSSRDAWRGSHQKAFEVVYAPMLQLQEKSPAFAKVLDGYLGWCHDFAYCSP